MPIPTVLPPTRLWWENYKATIIQEQLKRNKMRSMIRIKRTFNLILTLALMLTMAQTAWAQEAAVYDLVTEVPTVDGGQSTNSGSTTNQNLSAVKRPKRSRRKHECLWGTCKKVVRCRIKGWEAVWKVKSAAMIVKSMTLINKSTSMIDKSKALIDKTKTLIASLLKAMGAMRFESSLDDDSIKSYFNLNVNNGCWSVRIG